MKPKPHFTARVKILERKTAPASLLGAKYVGKLVFPDGDQHRFRTSWEFEEGKEYVVVGGFDEDELLGEPIVEITKPVDASEILP